MKTEYSDCRIVSIRFDDWQVKAINELACQLRLPRTTIAKRLFGMVLDDVKTGRRIFQEGM
jgi:hypothetical protein